MLAGLIQVEGSRARVVIGRRGGFKGGRPLLGLELVRDVDCGLGEVVVVDLGDQLLFLGEGFAISRDVGDCSPRLGLGPRT